MPTIPLSQFRRRLVRHLDQVAYTQQPLVLTRQGEPVAIIWKAYGPKKLEEKVNHLDFCLRMVALEVASKGIDLKAELFGADPEDTEPKLKRRPSSKPVNRGPR